MGMGDNGGRKDGKQVVGYGNKSVRKFDDVTPSECKKLLKGKPTPDGGCKVLAREVFVEDDEGHRSKETEFLEYTQIG